MHIIETAMGTKTLSASICRSYAGQPRIQILHHIIPVPVCRAAIVMCSLSVFVEVMYVDKGWHMFSMRYIGLFHN